MTTNPTTSLPDDDPNKPAPADKLPSMGDDTDPGVAALQEELGGSGAGKTDIGFVAGLLGNADAQKALGALREQSEEGPSQSR